LISELERRREFATVKLSWASGLMIVVRTGGAQDGMQPPALVE
jgi:hypothetical protein